MLKKLITFLLLPLVLSGCANSRQIESAAIIENVSVDSRGGQLFYTFFLLTDSDKPNGVEIPAKSFEEARKLAEERFIPNMSLSKLELLLLNREIDTQALRADIEYISTQASFSPIAYVALCDSKVLAKAAENTGTQSLIEKLLILCKNNNSEVKTDYLSVFNSFAKEDAGGFYVPLITFDGELRVSAVNIREKTQ